MNTKDEGEQDITMSVADLLAQHPLPWSHHVLLIKDADGRQVIHTGGSYNEFSRLYEGRYLSGLNALIVSAVNARSTTSDYRRALEQIAELEGDSENQNFRLTRFQAAQIARRALLTNRHGLKTYEALHQQEAE